MDEQMIELIARAIARATIEAAEPEKVGRLSEAAIDALVENIAVKFFPEARAAHSVIAGKVAELEATNRRLVETLRPYLKQEEAIASARQQMRDELAEERAALAPYPERRSE